MNGHSSEHATFVIERRFQAPVGRVFAAWTSVEAKSRWFGLPSPADFELDFQVGGLERFVVEVDGRRYTYLARYQDIVAERRIVYTYEMYRDDHRMSVSVATIELDAAEPGTKLTMTEQGVFLDGHDTAAEREHGTRELIERLAEILG